MEYYLGQLIWIFSIHFFWKFAERVGKSQEKEIRERKTNGREGSRKSKYMRYVYTGLKKKNTICAMHFSVFTET